MDRITCAVVWAALFFISTNTLASFPLKVSDRNFSDDISRADPYISSILRLHEEAFPGALNRKALYYYTPLDRLSRIQQGLLSDLIRIPEYRRLLTTREALLELKVSALEPIAFQTRSSFSKFRWWKTLDTLVDVLNEIAEAKQSKNASQLLTAVRSHILSLAEKEREPWDKVENRDLVRAWILAESIQQKTTGLSLHELRSTIAD